MRRLPVLLALAMVTLAGGVDAHPGARADERLLSRRVDLDGDTGALIARAAARRELGALDDAATDLDHAARAGGPAAPIALERARIAVARGDDAAAEAHYDAALIGARPPEAREPSRLFVDALAERAALRARGGRLADARADLDVVLAIRPDADVALARGSIDERTGDLAVAAAGYREALERLDAVVLRRALARVELARGAWDQAIAVADAALAGRSPRTDWLLVRAEAHAGAGRVALAERDRREALDEADRAVAARPTELRRLARGRVLLALGRHGEAAAIAAAVLQERPHLDEARALLADARSRPPTLHEATR